MGNNNTCAVDVEVSGAKSLNLDISEKENLNVDVQPISEGGVGGSKDAVLYVEQSLDEEQKKQARKNIGVTGDYVFTGTYDLANEEPGSGAIPATLDDGYKWSDLQTTLAENGSVRCVLFNSSGKRPIYLMPHDAGTTTTVVQLMALSNNGAYKIRVTESEIGELESSELTRIEFSTMQEVKSFIEENKDLLKGDDGISPVVTVSEIEGGHRVTITDKDGEKSFDVMDGENAEGGSGVGQFYDGGTGEIFNEYAHNEASGKYSHAEGSWTIASRSASHAEGHGTRAWGESSHAEGYSTKAEGFASHAEGYGSHATGRSQHVQGEFNVVDPNIGTSYGCSEQKVRGKYAHIVGNGTADDARSNAHTLDWNGLGWFAGGLKVGGTGQDDPNAEEIPTKNQVQKMVDDALEEVPTGDVYWDDVEDKPFGEEVVTTVEPLNIQWDGNTEGMTVVQSLVEPSLVWVKVSDEVFTDEQIKAMSFVFTGFGDELIPIVGSWELAVNVGSVADDFVVLDAFVDPFVVFIRKAGVTFGEDADILGGVTFQEPGVYFFYVDAEVFTPSLEGDIPRTKTIVHTIEPKYLPKALQFGEMPTGGDTLYWDGNTEGLFVVELPYGTFYKVSDVALTKEDVYCEDGTGSPIACFVGGDLPEFYRNDELAAITQDIVQAVNGELGYDDIVYPDDIDGYPLVCYVEQAICVFEDNCKIGVFDFPEKGIYFRSNIRSFSLLNCTKFPSTKLMDKKYLPMDDITAAVLAALPIYNGEVEEV